MSQLRIDNFIRPSAKLPPALNGGLLIDCFAGIGGASTASEAAHGRPVDCAINHWPLAIEYHTRNHPAPTKHFTADVWELEPLVVTGGGKVYHAHFSPDCRHFSNAKGGAPVSKRVRSLAWVVIKWAKQTRPAIITLENVKEFLTWGPLDETGRPDKARKGEYFKRWRRCLEREGYKVEWRVLNAADYGTPQSRRRLFLLARCDGLPIVWPEPTHGPEVENVRGNRNRNRNADEGDPEGHIRDAAPDSVLHGVDGEVAGRAAAVGRSNNVDLLRNVGGGGISGASQRLVCGIDGASQKSRRPLDGRVSTGKAFRLKPYRTAAECIDWNLSCPSIFLSKAEAKAAGLKVIRPLARKTCWRIANGLKRYVIEAAKPFIISTAYSGSTGRGKYVYPPEDPLRTVTSANDKAVVTPIIVGPSGRQTQTEARPVNHPLNTVTAKNDKAIIAPAIVKYYGQGDGQGAAEPLHTITTKDRFALTPAYLVKANHGGGDMRGQSVEEPLGTVTAARRGDAVVAPTLIECANSNWSEGSKPANAPLPTITAHPKGGSWAMSAAHLTHYHNPEGGAAAGEGADVRASDPREPMPTLDTSNRFAPVAAFLAKLRGMNGWRPAEVPLDVICAGAPTFAPVAAFLVKFWQQRMPRAAGGVAAGKYPSTQKSKSVSLKECDEKHPENDPPWL